MSKALFRAIVLLFFLMPVFAFAAPLSRQDVPEPLKPWTDWVLDTDQSCPYLSGIEDSRICAWSSRLDLSLSANSGSFSQQWSVYSDSWIPLPGDDERWPQEVKVGSVAAAVILMEGEPRVFLKKGEHVVTGSFRWDSIPDSFQVPSDTGIFRLTVQGTDIPFPNVDENGLVWLQGKEEEEESEDSLEVRVHRHIADDVPVVMTTRISLDVSGKTREVLLGPVVLKDFIPMSVESPLPLNVQPDGFLRLQVRAGQWQVQLSARHQGPVGSLTLPAGATGATSSVFQPDEEVWVFEARNDLRLVSVEGVPAVDPQQTTLPDDWKHLPAYRLAQGDTMRLVEQRRGDSDPAPDQLRLERNYWLDFDGSGFTIHDSITGTFSKSRRLEMNAPIKLGRVAVNGDSQLITSLPGQKQQGIEIRLGQALIVADSRLEDATYRAPAVGWDHNFQSVFGSLHLPPGWKLFAVTGADDVPATWLNGWTLLQIFLVLILTVSFARMWGIKCGIVAFFTFVLSFPESHSPQWIWLAVLVGSVLLRVIHKGRLLVLIKAYRLITIVILVVIAIPFMIQQVRLALYPSLEYSQQINADQSLGYGELEQQIRQRNAISNSQVPDSGITGGFANKQALEPQSPAPAIPPQEPESTVIGETPEVQQEAPKRKGDLSLSIARPKPVSSESYNKINPAALVQTGPGIPRWEGNSVALTWTGPVEKTQSLTFFLIPPAVNFLLSMLRVLLIAVLALCVIGFPKDFWPRLLSRPPTPESAATLFLAFAFFLFPSESHAAEFPSQEILDQLQQRLLDPPECYPDCSSISRMQLDVAGNSLRIRLEVGAQDQTAIPLPGDVAAWSPQQVMVDGRISTELYRSEEGTLWLKLSPGGHQVVLEGPLPNRQTVQIPLPMKPHHVAATVSGWTIDGLHEDGLVDENIQLTRLESGGAREGTEAAGESPSGALPPFVVIHRRLILGLNWQLETRVTRLTPAGSAVILEIPLLEGESVTTPGMRIQNGSVQISMAPQASDTQWTSVLKETPVIHLKASDSSAWAEVWQLDASPIWHVTLKGIPVIHQQGAEGTWLPEWRPWPGEKVDIAVIRPEGVTGQTVTIDASVLSVEPGLRYSNVVLSFNLRSSLGGQHTITLPKEAELQSVSINGSIHPVRKQEDKVTLPVTPGEQRVELKWQQPGGIRIMFRSPVVGLGLPSVNSETLFRFPLDRWIFFVGGPGVGPAVLFWAFFVVLAIISFGLGRVHTTPLKAHHWLLLGLGLSQVDIWASLTIAAWLLVLGWRNDKPIANKWLFDLFQFVLAAWTVVALVLVFVSIRQGLVGGPDMQIEGNNSTASLLRWFQDRSPETLMQSWIISLPLYWYRIAMLLWALWLALALIRWLKWAWQCFSAGTFWKPLRVKKQPPPLTQVENAPPPPGAES